MNTLRRTVNNIALLMSGQVVTWVSTLILSAAYGRFLGANGFGELYLATTFTSLIGFPIEFSFNQQVVRDVAREPLHARRYITMSLVLKGVLWVGLFALALLLSVLLGYSPIVRWLIVISGIMLVTSAISSTLIAVQTAFMQPGMAKFGSVIEKVVDTILAVLLLRAGADVIPVALALLVGSIAGMVWQIVRTARLLGFRFEWDGPVARTLIRSGMSFLAYGVIGVIYYRIDTILLSVYATNSAIGVYGAAYRLFDTLTFIPGIVVGSIMSPILSRYAVDTDKGKLRLAIEKSTTAMLLCSAPAAAGLIVAAPNIIGFVYQRQDFAGSEGVLQALAIGLIALYLNSVLTTVLVSTGQERKLPIMAIAALVFNVALNLFLIPRFMDMGAAWATSLTEALLLGIGLGLMDRSLIPVRLWKITVKIAVASLVMAVVATALNTYTIVVIMPIAAVVYVGAVLALRVLPAEDMAQIKSLFSRFAPRQVPAVGADQALAQAAPDLAIAGASGLMSAAPGRPTLDEQVARAGAGHPLASAEGVDLAQPTARDERSLSLSVPLNYPVRIPGGLFLPFYHVGGETTPVLQRRIQRRLARLDRRQVAAALAQHQLGHLALSMRRVELLPATLAPGRDLAAIRLGGSAAQVGALRTGDHARQRGSDEVPAIPAIPAYCLAISRQRPQKAGKDNHGRRVRREKHDAAGYAGRPSRPRATLDPAIARGFQLLDARPSEETRKRSQREPALAVAAGQPGETHTQQALQPELT